MLLLMYTMAFLILSFFLPLFEGNQNLKVEEAMNETEKERKPEAKKKDFFTPPSPPFFPPP